MFSAPGLARLIPATAFSLVAVVFLPLVGYAQQAPEVPAMTFTPQKRDFGTVTITVKGKNAANAVLKMVMPTVVTDSDADEETHFHVMIPHQFAHGETPNDRAYTVEVEYNLNTTDRWELDHTAAPGINSLTSEDNEYSAGPDGQDPAPRAGTETQAIPAASRRLVVMLEGMPVGDRDEEIRSHRVRIFVFTPGIAIRAYDSAAFTASGPEIPRPSEKGSTYYVMPQVVPEPKEPPFPPDDGEENYVKVNLQLAPNSSQLGECMVSISRGPVQAWDLQRNAVPASVVLLIASDGTAGVVGEGPPSLANISQPGGVDVWVRMPSSLPDGAMPSFVLQYSLSMGPKTTHINDEVFFQQPLTIKVPKIKWEPDRNAPVEGEFLEEELIAEHGVFIPLNSDDDNYSGVPDKDDVDELGNLIPIEGPNGELAETDLLPVIIKPFPVENGKLVVVGSEHIRIWRNANRSDRVYGKNEPDGTAATLLDTIETTLYIEGVDVGEGSLEFEQISDEKIIAKAQLEVRVFDIQGPTEVPADGTYNYSVIGGVSGEWLEPHSGEISQPAPEDGSVEIRWRSLPSKGATGAVRYEPIPGLQWGREIDVVRLQIYRTPGEGEHALMPKNVLTGWDVVGIAWDDPEDNWGGLCCRRTIMKDHVW